MISVVEETTKKIVSSKSAAIVYSTKVSWRHQLQVDGSEMTLHQFCTYRRYLLNRHILDPIHLNAWPLFTCSLCPCALQIAERSAILCSSATSK